jgi:BirA family biotin operon repressor/biotin-[acetyl-CoA-carboxylase] ligase
VIKDTQKRILGILKSRRDHISGEEISAGLGITRAAVWKHIRDLRKSGYEIASSTNRGYRLRPAGDVLNESEILDKCGTEIIGRHIVYLNKVDSTNNHAKKLALEGSIDGTVVVAGLQTAGRGRFGREWLSGEDGIAMSLILKPDAPAADVSGMTLLAGFAVCKALREITLQDCRIKWPNDIVLNGRKVCGILTELTAEAESIHHLVIGIGVNVNNDAFPQTLRDRATSLFIETGEIYSRKVIIHRILLDFEKYYLRYLADHNLSSLLEEFSGLCATIGADVTATSRGEEIAGKAVEIDPTGALVLLRPDGSRVAVISGEVSVRGINGYL